MLIKLPEGPILVDNNPLISDVKINITKQKQARIKLVYHHKDGKENPLDIVIYGFTFPKLNSVSTVSMDIVGKELISEKDFKLEISYKFLKGIWSINGTYNKHNISHTWKRFQEFMQVVSKILAM